MLPLLGFLGQVARPEDDAPFVAETVTCTCQELGFKRNSGNSDAYGQLLFPKSGWESGPPCSPVLRGRPLGRGLRTYPDVIVFAVPRLPSVPDGQADGEEEQQDAGPDQDVGHREGLVPVQEPFGDLGLVVVTAGRMRLGAEAEARDQVPDGHDDSEDQHPQPNGRQGIVGAAAGPGLGHPQWLSGETQWLPSSSADEGPGLGLLRRSKWEKGIWRKTRDRGVCVCQTQVKNIPGKAAGAEVQKLKFGLLSF